MTETPRIYVASLSDYNNGFLYGTWIDADGTVDIHEEVQEMLKASPTNDEARCEECGVLGVMHERMLAELPELSLRHDYVPDQVAEEWAIHDYDGFLGIKIGEWESFDRVAQLGELVREHGQAFAVFASHYGSDGDPYEIRDAFEEQYIGEMTALDYAYDYIEETGALDDMPESLRNYFDYQGFARDLILGGDVFEDDGFLFHSR